ncbi:MAG: thioredoxin family protein [Candidatus Micrarchaeota archaeon]
MKKFKSGSEFKASLKSDEQMVLFYASWCPFCRSFCPKFEAKFDKSDKHIMVAIDEDSDGSWIDYKIDAVPTVLVFKGKKITKRFDAVPGVGLKIETIS